MAFKRFLEDKELTDLKGDTLLDAFVQSGFDAKSEIFETIHSNIQKNNLDAKLILKSTESEIIKVFNLQCEEDKNKLLLMRAIIRKTYALKNPISASGLNKTEVEKFSKEKIYQLLENEINSTGDEQSQKWYSYMEKEAMTGGSFLKLGICELVKVLDLSQNQAINLGTLLEKIDPPVQSGHHVEASNGTYGYVGIGNWTGNYLMSTGRERENNSKSSENKYSDNDKPPQDKCSKQI